MKNDTTHTFINIIKIILSVSVKIIVAVFGFIESLFKTPPTTEEQLRLRQIVQENKAAAYGQESGKRIYYKKVYQHKKQEQIERQEENARIQRWNKIRTYGVESTMHRRR